MVHTFTCTGLIETQYHSFSKAAWMGSVMDKTIVTRVWLSFCFFFYISYVLENFDVLLLLYIAGFTK